MRNTLRHGNNFIKPADNVEIWFQGGDLQIMEVVQELLPVLPSVATQLVPEIANRLVSRIVARTLRELAISFWLAVPVV